LISIPIFGWALIKPFLIQIKNTALAEEQLRILKYNRNIFSAAVKQSPPIGSPDESFAIVLGNRLSTHIITIVGSPFCKPCARAYRQIDKALDTNKDLQVRFVFAGNHITLNNESMAVRRHFMSLRNLSDGGQTIKSALADWYTNEAKNYNYIAKKFPISICDNANSLLASQQSWVSLHSIYATPTILINGYRMPLVYQMDELKYMLEEL
jgi:hypothetical protein